MAWGKVRRQVPNALTNCLSINAAIFHDRYINCNIRIIHINWYVFSFHCSVIEIDASQRPVCLPESGARRPKAVVPLIAVSRRLVNAAARRIQLWRPPWRSAMITMEVRLLTLAQACLVALRMRRIGWFARLVAACLCTVAAHAQDNPSAPIVTPPDGFVNGSGTTVGLPSDPNDPYLFTGFTSGSYYLGLSGTNTYSNSGRTIFVSVSSPISYRSILEFLDA